MTKRAERLYEVLRYVRPLHQYSAKAVADALAEHEVTMPMRAVLERLADGDPLTVPQIARSLWLPRQVVQRLTDAAADLDLVEYRPNPAHRRSKLVRLTLHGAATFAEVHAGELRDLDGIARELDPGDIEAAVRVIAALTDGVRQRALRRDDDHGWSTPGPRPGEESR